MSEGTCEAAEEGVMMTAQSWHMTPTVGGPPLMLVMEDGRNLQVRVDNVHVEHSDPDHGHTEIYHFTPLEGTQEEKGGGLLSGLKSLFHREGHSSEERGRE